MVGGNVNCAVTIENSMEVPFKKLKNRVVMSSSNLTPGNISMEN